MLLEICDLKVLVAVFDDLALGWEIASIDQYFLLE
jgi:hypothetical protein